MEIPVGVTQHSRKTACSRKAFLSPSFPLSIPPSFHFPSISPLPPSLQYFLPHSQITHSLTTTPSFPQSLSSLHPSFPLRLPPSLHCQSIRCFELFRIIHSLVDDADAVKLVAREVVRDFAQDGVVYLELRTTVKAIPGAGMSEEDYLSAVVEGIQEACRNDDTQIQVR